MQGHVDNRVSYPRELSVVTRSEQLPTWLWADHLRDGCLEVDLRLLASFNCKVSIICGAMLFTLDVGVANCQA